MTDHQEKLEWVGMATMLGEALTLLLKDPENNLPWAKYVAARWDLFNNPASCDMCSRVGARFPVHPGGSNPDDLAVCAMCRGLTEKAA